MKCPTCGSNRMYGDEEIVCDNCGSSFELTYLGYYPDADADRIDEGFEDKEWLDKWKPKNKEVQNDSKL